MLRVRAPSTEFCIRFTGQVLTTRERETGALLKAMEAAWAFRIVRTGLQAVAGCDVAPVVDSITTQPILAISVAVCRASALARIGLADAVEPRRRAPFTNQIAHFTAVTVGVRGAFDATAVRIADQSV